MNAGFLYSDWGTFEYGWILLAVYVVVVYIGMYTVIKSNNSLSLTLSIIALVTSIVIFSAIMSSMDCEKVQFSESEYDVDALRRDLETSGVNVKVKQNNIYDHGAWLTRRRISAFGIETWEFTPAYTSNIDHNYDDYRLNHDERSSR